MAVKKGLGKGLDALFLDNSSETKGGTELIKLNEIEPNRGQPRKFFEEEALQQLADSIKEHGLIQPLLVRPIPTGSYQIIAGERRWRASRMAGLTEVPVVVMDVDDAKTMELALIENLQRENLNIIEEALGYKELMESYSMTQEGVSKSVGKSRSAVANTLRLLNLPDAVLAMVQRGDLSAGHARALLAFPEDRAVELAKQSVKKQLTVRDLERFAREADKPQDKEKPKKMRDSYFSEVELSLKNEYNRKVKVSVGENGKGVLELFFYNKDDLKNLLQQLTENKEKGE